MKRWQRYTQLYNMNIHGLRFFTVYGKMEEWYVYVKIFKLKEKFDLYNIEIIIGYFYRWC